MELGLRNLHGVLVGSLFKNGPAYKSGIKARDVIIRINNKKIKNFRDLLRIVSKTKIGKTLKVTVWRNKRRANFWVKVEERP